MLVEVNVFVCWKWIEDMRFCIELIDLYVDIEYRDCILFVVLSSFFCFVFSSIFSFWQEFFGGSHAPPPKKGGTKSGGNRGK